MKKRGARRGKAGKDDGAAIVEMTFAFPILNFVIIAIAELGVASTATRQPLLPAVSKHRSPLSWVMPADADCQVLIGVANVLGATINGGWFSLQ